MRLSPHEQDLFNALKAQLAGATSTDPAIGSARSLITRLEASTRLSSPQRIFSVPFSSAVVVASTGIVPTAPTPFVFPIDCRVIGIKGMVLEGMNLLSHVALTITDEENYPIFTNGGQAGQSGVAAPVTFASLVGNPYDQGGFYRFLDRDIQAQRQWMIQCTSKDAVPASGSTTYTPELLILVELTPTQGRRQN